MNRQTSIETDDHFAVMFEQMPVGVALYDAQTFCLLAANPLFLQFLDPPWRGNVQVIGHSPLTWLPEAREQGVMEIFRVVAETGIPYRSGIYMFPAFERGITYWNWTLSPLRDQDGQIVRLLQTVVEITEQVEAQQ
ncbi:MAG: PAS domain-containing protein, partial [Ktedonobacteraceae bacterium]